jgi:hypothetical protein
VGLNIGLGRFGSSFLSSIPSMVLRCSETKRRRSVLSAKPMSVSTIYHGQHRTGLQRRRLTGVEYGNVSNCEESLFS